MLLRTLEIRNYKSFFEDTSMQFGPGFNVLLGANSSGKTTVLQSIRFMEVQNVPHRSISNILDEDTPWSENSRIKATFDFPLPQFQKLVPANGFQILIQNDAGQRLGTNSDIESYWQKNEIKIQFSREFGNNLQFCTYPLGQKSKQRGIPNRGTTTEWRATISQQNISFVEGQTLIGSEHYGDIDHVATNIHNRIYRFSAERLVRAFHGFSTNELNPDASNLAYCINHLKSADDITFERLNTYVNRIFPTIHRIGAVPSANQNFYLKVQTVPREMDRSDLAIPIDQVGTGVTNAIAMLYVVLTSKTPRIILLEEPNSYLHPRALRELMSILTEIGSKHQFFVTTHSSDVLRSVKASTVTLLENDGIKTSVRQTMHENLQTFQAGLLDLGIHLTDLHGCDRVLWVEGETEEAIFPKLLAHFFPQIAQGVAVLRLHATGDFESRKIKPGKVAEIYKRLSQATFLAPPMVAITLDREGKQDSQVESMMKECEGVVFLLPKPMVEDYLLDARALIFVLEDSKAIGIDVAKIEIALELAKQDSSNRLLPMHPTNKTIHAAKVLSAIFKEFAPPGIDYSKAKHGPMLAEWILRNDPRQFNELRDWMKLFIK